MRSIVWKLCNDNCGRDIQEDMRWMFGCSLQGPAVSVLPSNLNGKIAEQCMNGAKVDGHQWRYAPPFKKIGSIFLC